MTEPTPERAVPCGYCKTAMIAVVLGWHCPACHATVGQEKPVRY